MKPEMKKIDRVVQKKPHCPNYFKKHLRRSCHCQAIIYGQRKHTLHRLHLNASILLFLRKILAENKEMNEVLEKWSSKLGEA